MKIDMLKEELNKIKFYKCNNVNMGDVLHYGLTNECSWKLFFKAWLSAVYYALYSFCDLRLYGNGKTLMLYSNPMKERKDHRESFNNVSNLIDDKLVVTPSRRKIRFSNMRYLFIPLIWCCQMRKIPISFKTKVWLSCREFLRAYYDYIDVQRFIKKNDINIRYLITYCDVSPVDSFFTQKFNAKGITTLTLQHAPYNIASDSWGYLGSKSKFFFAEEVLDIVKKCLLLDPRIA